MPEENAVAPTGPAPSAAPPTSVFEYTQKNVVQLVAWLRELHEQRGVVYIDLYEKCGFLPKKPDKRDRKKTQERFTRILSGIEEKPANWWKLPEDSYNALLGRVLSLRGETEAGAAALFSQFPDAMFFGVRLRLRNTSHTLNDLQKNFPGTYTIYRPTINVPDHIAIGSLKIVVAPSGAVTTTEDYSIEGTHEDEQSQKPKPTLFHVDGYLFRKHGKYHAIGYHRANLKPQVLFINNREREGGNNEDETRKIVRISGIAFDVQERHYYATRFVCVRGKPPSPLKPLTTVPFDNIRDSSIRKTLDRTITTEHRIVEFL